tara:strand:- start:371 stop:484 length:114 start_codon:yes stop_codon:yes gene_type:complete
MLLFVALVLFVINNRLLVGDKGSKYCPIQCKGEFVNG